MTTQPEPTLFGLTAEDIGRIASEAFYDTTVFAPDWTTIGAMVLAKLLIAERILQEMAPDEAESRKQEHIKRMLSHLEKSK